MSCTDHVKLLSSALILLFSLSNIYLIVLICEQVSPSQFEAHAGMAARRQP